MAGNLFRREVVSEMNSSPLNAKYMFGSYSLFLACIALIAPACSLATSFDQDDKPCDGYQKCEDGYYCQIQDSEKGTGICIKGTSNKANNLLTESSSQIFPMNSIKERISQASEISIQTQDTSPKLLFPCEENACHLWRGYICDQERQICVPQT